MKTNRLIFPTLFLPWCVIRVSKNPIVRSKRLCISYERWLRTFYSCQEKESFFFFLYVCILFTCSLCLSKLSKGIKQNTSRPLRGVTVGSCIFCQETNYLFTQYLLSLECYDFPFSVKAWNRRLHILYKVCLGCDNRWRGFSCCSALFVPSPTGPLPLVF